MIQGVRKPEEVQGLGVSRRLLVRIGALLNKRIEITPAVLEAAPQGSPRENLLLDPKLLAEAEALDAAGFAKLCAAHLPDAPDAPILHRDDDGRRVICLAEELEAQGAWSAGEPARSAEPPAYETTTALAAAPSGGLARHVQGLRDGGVSAEGLFTRIELERLRLRLVTAAGAGDRIEALRTLAHAPLSPQEKAELLFRALDDRDPSVRAEAAELLFVLGVEDELRENLYALCQGEVRARVLAAQRLAKRLGGKAPELERVATAVCALGSLKGERTPELNAEVLNLLAHCASALAPEPARVAELVRLSLGLLGEATGKGTSFKDSDRIYLPTQKLFRALCKDAPGVAMPLLLEERDKTTQPAVEAFLLQMLLEHVPAGDAKEPEVLRMCASYLARDTQEDRDSRSVGMALVRRGESALAPLVDAFPNASSTAQKYALNLLDQILRFSPASRESKERAAEVALKATDSTQRSVRMAAMVCRYVVDPEISEALRGKLAEAFLSNIFDFGFPTDREIAEDTVSMLGLPALGPLAKRLAAERPDEVRAQAVRILGQLALELKPRHGEMTNASRELTDALRRLQALAAEPDFPHREALFTSMGKIAASPAASKQAGQIVTRTLLQSVKADLELKRLDALEGLTWLAASRRADPELVVTVTGLLRRVVDQIQAEIQSQSFEVDGESVIEISQERGLVEVLPVALKGIARIAVSRNCPPAVVKEELDLLIERWKRICAGDLVWGPGNQILIVHALKEIGCHDGLRDEWRMLILKALAPRLDHPPVMSAIAQILHASDAPASAAAALTVGQAILDHRRLDGQYDSEDRPEILKALCLIVCRKHLGAADAANRAKATRYRDTVIDDLFKGAQDLVRGAYQNLVALRDAKVLPEALQKKLEERLAQYGALQKY